MLNIFKYTLNIFLYILCTYLHISHIIYFFSRYLLHLMFLKPTVDDIQIAITMDRCTIYKSHFKMGLMKPADDYRKTKVTSGAALV